MSYLQRLRASVLGFAGYVQLLRNPSGPLGYYALTLLVILAVAAGISTVQAKATLAEAAQAVAAAPDFGFRNGQVEFAGEQPFRWVDPQKGTVIIIDTTGQTKPEAIRNAPAGSILITRTHVYEQKGTRWRETDLSPIPFSFDKSMVVGLLQGLHWFVPLGYLLLYPVQLGSKALGAVVLALIAMIAGGVGGKKPSFELGWKAGLYALTLPTAIQWLVPWYQGTVWRLVFWGIAATYTVLGVRAYLQAEAEPTDPPAEA